MRIRPATVEDLPAIKAIYDEEVWNGIATFATVPPALDLWRTRLESAAPGDHLVVADDGEAVVGYASSAAYRPREAYAHTRETAVYLTAAARGRGVGRSLYDDVLARMRADAVRMAVAVVALPNDASRALHLACGYTSAGVLHEVGHKFGRWIDTELFERRLSLDPGVR